MNRAPIPHLRKSIAPGATLCGAILRSVEG